MVCIDAFSRAYISKEYTPFLSELASRGIATSLSPLFAFRGIETTMFTGVWPEVHGIWTENCLRPTNSSAFSSLSALLVRSLDLLGSDKVRKLGRVAMQCLRDRTSTRLTPNLIPAEAFGYFEPSQKKAIFEQGAAGMTPTLFDVLRNNKFDFAFIEPPFIGGDKGVVERVDSLCKSHKDIKFWYLKFGSPDKAGHNNGPIPDKIKSTLRQIDKYLEQVIRILQKRFGDLDIMIMADHGMSRVDSYFDMLQDLRALNSDMYKDYVLFLDSTMARFWFFNDRARSEIEDYLMKLRHGWVLSDQEFKDLHIPLDRRYGECIFVMYEGKMIYPDFWSGSRKAKGMHGYAIPKSNEAIPILILNKEISQYCKKNKAFTYVDIFSILQESLFTT